MIAATVTGCRKLYTYFDNGAVTKSGFKDHLVKNSQALVVQSSCALGANHSFAQSKIEESDLEEDPTYW